MRDPTIEQRRLVYRGREFHFVAYPGAPADLKRNRPGTEAAWWLMSAGKRWEVLPFRADQPAEEVERLLARWLEKHAFDSPHDAGA